MTSAGWSSTAAGALVEAVAELKPRLRGWLHTYAAGLSILSGAALIAVAAALRGGTAGATTAIYSATVTLLFATSALYHRGAWQPRTARLLKRLDHSMIFMLIGGTYTPICALALPHTAAIVVLATVWSGAFLGVLLKLGWPTAPRWLSAPCYIGLGWVAVFVMPQLLHAGGVAALVLIIAGGLGYTAGGVVYALKRPDPIPAVFGFHEVFHTLTLVAAVCHYIAVWLVVFA